MNPSLRPVLRLFFLSGLASLGYELVFTKLLGYIFGITAYATSTVLASFMGGLALGSAVIARSADRIRRPLRLYALVELGIGAYMLAVPSLLELVRAGYVGLNRAAPLSPGELTLVRFLLGGAIVVLPSALMGATLPLLARHFVRSGGGDAAVVARLYATNTFGAAAGVVAANYLLLPWTGIYGALAAGALVNLYVGLRALRLQRAPAPAERSPHSEVPAAGGGASLVGDRTLLLVALLTGFVAFGYEVVWTHLLAVVVGSSAYAFGDMLLAFLLGIAGGSAWLARHPAAPGTQLLRLARCQLGVGIAVVATLPLWDRLPLVFQLIGYLFPGFYLREAVRLAASLAVMAIPTCLMGVSFPLLIDALRGGPEQLGRRIGRAYALNTFGAILGSVVTGFGLLPAVGSRLSLLVAAGLSILLGTALLWRAGGAALRPIQLRSSIAAALVLLVGFVFLPGWNYEALLSGSNVYFGPPPRPGRMVFVHEDVQSGVTSVQQRTGNELELRTNGKGEGNNRGQMEAQWGFALIPALLSHRWERAAVIGLGTGVTAGTIARFPYRQIDIAELSPGIVAAARRYFSDVNGAVLDDPRVRLVLEDGRNLLLLSEQARYDLITIEVTSIWFAGAANLYSREFVELVKARLAPGGVFQQWVQFHHISPLDILRILNTVRQVFPHVTLWHNGSQGMLVASERPLRADYPTVLRLTSAPTMGPVFDSLPLRHPFALFGDLLLDEAQVDSAITYVSRRVGPALTRRFFVSSDLLPWLEYSTPRRNAELMQYGATLKFFENYDAHRPPPIDGLPPSERELVYGLAALQKGNAGNALRLLEQATAQRPGDSALASLVARLRRQVEAHPL